MTRLGIMACSALCALLWVGTTAAQTSSLLWKVTGNGLTQPSYLFGTVHILGRNEYFVPDSLTPALKRCRVLVTEANTDLGMIEQVKLGQQMMMPKGKGLEDFLPADDYTKVQAYFVDSLKVGEGKFKKVYRKMKPFFLSSLIITDMYDNKIESYEKNLTRLAKDNKLELDYFETVQYQMGLIEGITLEDQAAQLAESIKVGPDPRSEFKQLVATYKTQNIDSLYALTYASTTAKKYPDFLTKFIENRNRNWIDLFATKAAAKPLFVAVGAAHLGGPNGVISLLRQKGYTVEPIR